MLSFYCYNSPTQSSAGFQEGLWTLGEVCAEADPKLALPELRAALLDGGAKALCFDTSRETKAFLMRGVFVRLGGQSGWHMNFILETDAGHYALWADTVAALLSDYAGMTEKLARLFSVQYDGGEHSVLDTEGFVQWLQNASGAAAAFCEGLEPGGPLEVFHRFAGKLREPFSVQSGRLILLAPASTAGYFVRHTSLKTLSAPELCVDSRRWDAFLAHKDLREEAGQEEPLEPEYAKDEGVSGLFLACAAGTLLVGGLLISSVVRHVRSRRRRKGR